MRPIIGWKFACYFKFNQQSNNGRDIPTVGSSEKNGFSTDRQNHQWHTISTARRNPKSHGHSRKASKIWPRFLWSTLSKKWKVENVLFIRLVDKFSKALIIMDRVNVGVISKYLSENHENFRVHVTLVALAEYDFRFLTKIYWSLIRTLLGRTIFF